MSIASNSLYYPTVTSGACASGSNCAAGSLCTSSSQCAPGNCCAYLFTSMGAGSYYYNEFLKQYVSSIVSTTFNSTTNRNLYILNSTTAADALQNSYYETNRYCFSSVYGASNITFYNTTTDTGISVFSN